MQTYEKYNSRVISLPFKNIPELLSKTQYRILVAPGTSFEDAFKTSKDPNWQIAWKERLEPHLKEHIDFLKPEFIKKITRDGVSAFYDNYFSTM